MVVPTVPPPAAEPVVTVPAAPPAAPVNGNGHANGNGHQAEATGSLRRRVRHADDAPAAVGAPVVHGPARSADDVRSRWNRLAAGVQQARAETHPTPTDDAQEGTAP
jgi:hypothetical protein